MLNFFAEKPKSATYLVLGGLFGLSFPVIALSVDIFIMNGLPFELDSIIYVHLINPLNFIVDFAPIVIAVVFYYLGVNADKVAYYSKNLQNLVAERTEQLQISQQETVTVLNAIDEGLFVISRDKDQYQIAGQQSAAIGNIFRVEKLPSIDFSAALNSYLSPAKMLELTNFLRILPMPSFIPEMLTDLNPLSLVNVAVGNPPVEKYLQFSFTYVTEGKQDQFLVRVKDMTQATLMALELKANEKKNEENTQMVLSVLHIGPGLLRDFIESVDQELEIIEEILQSDKTSLEVAGRLEELYRSAHSIKGNASLLDLKILTVVAHEFEEKIIKVIETKNPQWHDFITLAVDVSKLQTTLIGLKDLLLRLQAFRQDTGGKTESAIAAIPQSIIGMVERLAEENGKQINVDVEHFDTEGVPSRFAYILRDISVQIVRNAIAHGIETPEVRISAEKPQAGKITLTLKKEPEYFLFSIKDDGKSFDFEAIRRLAAERKKASPEVAALWDQEKLLQIIYEPGFSTAKTATMTAGRGMGLDIVLQRVTKVGGEVKINYTVGMFTEFKMQIPLST